MVDIAHSRMKSNDGKDSKERKVRSRAPKSKNGCRTCKKRRVKCDEQKPTCLRCRTFGVECGGYEEPVRPIQRVIQTRPWYINICPASALFRNQSEYQYFLSFKNELALDLNGFLPTEIWTSVVLQAAQAEPALRHLTISIAALAKSITQSKAHPFADDSLVHHQFAIKHYGKALQQIQGIILNKNHDPSSLPTTLIAALLIFCFENLHGDHEPAIAHIQSALRLMHRRLSASARQYSSLKHMCSIPGLEEDVLELFIKLDHNIQNRISQDPKSPRHSLLDITYHGNEFSMPSRFYSLAEAKKYIEHLQYRATPYLSHDPERNITRNSPERYVAFVEDMRQYHHAFEPLMRRALTPEGEHDFLAAATLRVMAISTDVSIQRVYLGDIVLPPGSFDTEFTEVVALARRVVADKRFKRMFVFECGFMPALFVPIVLSPTRSIQEEALRILTLAEGRVEITWNATILAQVGSQILAAEDEFARRAAENQAEGKKFRTIDAMKDAGWSCL